MFEWKDTFGDKGTVEKDDNGEIEITIWDGGYQNMSNVDQPTADAIASALLDVPDIRAKLARLAELEALCAVRKSCHLDEEPHE